MFPYRVASRLVTGLAVVTLVAGCGASASPSPSAAPTPTAAATAAPTATPVPTATPAPTPAPSLWTQGWAAAVTGTISCGTVIKAGAVGMFPPPFTLTDQDLLCTATASDPRVTGTGSLVLSLAGWDPALPVNGTNGVAWGYQEIQGPDGTWAGRTYGLYDKDGILHSYGIMVGSGVYEGLIYAVSGTVAASSSTAVTIGLIQPGAPPPGFPVTPFPAP